MAEFLFVYHGGSAPETPEAGEALMAKWRAWMEANGAAMTNPGSPVGMSKTVSAGSVADNGGPNPVSGFSVVTAGSMDAALEIAKGCPHLEMGTVEVAELFSM